MQMKEGAVKRTEIRNLLFVPIVNLMTGYRPDKNIWGGWWCRIHRYASEV